MVNLLGEVLEFSISGIFGLGYESFLSDKFHLNNPGVYLNRSEFPIDFPVWHNRDDVAMGKDAVVEKALGLDK